MSKRPASELGLESMAPSKIVKFDPAHNDNWQPTTFGAPPPHRVEGRSSHWNHSAKDSVKVVEYNEKEQPLRGLAKHYKDHTTNNPTVEVIIQPEAMVNTNKRVRSRMLWGDLIYTDDSDVVAVLMHMGFYAYSLTSPPPNVQDFHVLLKLLPPQDQYPSQQRNSLRSRCWYSKTNGCSFKVEKCWMVTKQGGNVYLDPCTDSAPTPPPTFAPSHLDRPMNTRAAAAGRQRTMQELTIQYNLCNEPWMKYNISLVADKGLKPSQWTSARLHKEVLFVETRNERFELARVKTEGDDASDQTEQYRWSKCHTALPLSLMRKAGVPLPSSHITTIHEHLTWEDFKWGSAVLWVKGEVYKLMRIHFMKTAHTAGSGGEAAAQHSDKAP